MKRSSGGKSSSGDDPFASKTTKLPTNVQVCARIRPLRSHIKSKERETLDKSPPQKKPIRFIPWGDLSKKKNPKAFPSAASKSSSNRGSQDNDACVAWDISDDNTSAFQSNKTEKVHGRTHSYTLDRIFGADSTTDEVYNDSVASLVKAAMEGYNSTVLAYGQTATGKTHTMTGNRDSPGLVPLCVNDCFKYVQGNSSDEPREYLFRFSYLEIYKEHIRDLLSSTTSAPEPVRLFDGPNGLIIRGLKEVVVSSPNKVFQLLKQGDKRRQVGATHMNQNSSRSHVVVRLKIESSFATNNSDETRISILSLVDLAGSESVRLNGTERREEGQYINKSLMALGQVVLGLSESCKTNGEHKTNKSYIPYRDSKLTRLLQQSLSGNAQMLLMCCISPLVSYLEESHNTFKFAARAKRIEQKASIQTTKNKDDTLLQTYRNEIEDLKKQLTEATQDKQRLQEEQRAFQKMKQNEEMPTENIEVVATSMTSSTVINESNTTRSATGEIEELVEAIQTMEHLILKSRPLQHQEDSNLFQNDPAGVMNNNTSLDTMNSNVKFDAVFDCVLQSEDLEADEDEDLLVDNDVDILTNRIEFDSATPPSKSPGHIPTTPRNYHQNIPTRSIEGTPIAENHLHSELTRVRGLLATVLQKRGIASVPKNDPPGDELFKHEKIRKSLDFSTPSGDPPPLCYRLDHSLAEELEAGINVDGIIGENHDETRKEEVEEKRTELESLRMQLEKQERTTSLRKADSHFLQLQLEYKDNLLEEVSSLLEAVEKRQEELERENLALRRELTVFREERGEERGIIIRNTPF